MRIRLIESGAVEEVEFSWGERMIEQGKATPAGPEPKPSKAKVTVTDKLPTEKTGEAAEGGAPETESAKPETAKKAGKKR